MNTDDQRLDKIRKLLAKAEDPAVTAAEAEAYNTKAAELIAAYGIDAALLAAADPKKDELTSLVIGLDPPYARDKADLLWGVATPLRCKGILRTGWNAASARKELTMHLFGYRSDLDRAELLFTSLLIQAAHGLATAEPGWIRDPVRLEYVRESPAAYRRTWLAGFTWAVRGRLVAAEKRAQQQAEPKPGSAGPSVALVLADRSALVKQAVEAAHPDAKTAADRRLSGSGTREGWQAGQRADLGTTRISASARALRGSR